MITRLGMFKKNFSKIAPYMISEYACIASTIPIHPTVKVKCLFFFIKNKLRLKSRNFF